MMEIFMTMRRHSPFLSKPEKNKIFYMKCYGFLLLGLYIAILEVRARNMIFRRFVAKNKEEISGREVGETGKVGSI